MMSEKVTGLCHIFHKIGKIVILKADGIIIG
jgi:hypothetical protein